MMFQQLIQISKSVSFLTIILTVSCLAGCRSLPEVKLGQCENLDTKQFVRTFNLKIPENIRFRYSFRRKNVEFVCDGIIQQKESVTHIAGFSNSGITLFSALRENGQFSVLRNNTKMPESFLVNSVLNDLLIMYRKPSGNERCVRRNQFSGSPWLEMEDPLAGQTGYFVINLDNMAWIGVQNNKLCYRATMANKKELDCLYIENYKEKYRSEIRILDVPGGRGSLQIRIQD